MAEKTAEEIATEKAAKIKADADERAAEELETLRADLTEEKAKRTAAESLMRKTTAALQKLETARKAEAAGMTEDKLKELREEARAEVLAELKPQLDEATTLKAQNRTLLLDGAIKKLALEKGVLAEKVGDFWKLRGDEFDLTDDGKPMVRGKPGLDPIKHIESLKKLNPEWVAGTKAAGGGAMGTFAGAGTGSTFDDKMKPEDRMAAAHAAGLTE